MTNAKIGASPIRWLPVSPVTVPTMAGPRNDVILPEA